MPTGRHRAATRRDTPRPQRPARTAVHRMVGGSPVRTAAFTAPVLTAGVVGVGIAGSVGATSVGPDVAAAHLRQVSAPASGAVEASPSTSTEELQRSARLTRSADRLAGRAAVRTGLVGRQASQRLVRFTTDTLDVRATPAADAQVSEEISSGTRVIATGLVQGAYAEVSWKGERRWVTAQYLADQRPTDPADLPLSDAPCPDGSVEHGLTSGAVRVYRAVCHAFPDITSYGGWDAHGEHASGKAIDIMHPSVEEGYRIADFLRAHAAELNLYDVIWRQHIWTPVRSGEGWRSMPNRGSATANHFDHVHVSVN